MSTPKKIVHLIDFLGPGGAQELVRLQIKRSSPDFRHEVVSLTSLKPYYEEAIREAGADVSYLSRSWKMGLILKSPLLYYRFLKILKKSRPDILCLHMPGSMIIGCLASLGMKIKRVLTIYAWKRAFSPLVYPCIRLCTPFLDRIAWVEKSEIPWVCDEKFVKIFPGVETPLDFTAAAENIKNEFSLEGKGPFLFSIARIHPHKRHADALQAFVEVRKDIPDAVLFVIGEGEKKETERLHALAKKLGSDGIVFTGYRHDLKAFLGLGGFFLRPSENECGNMSTILAAFAGLVALGYDMKGIVPNAIEMIQQDQTGKLVHFGDYAAMAREVKALWKNPQEFKRLSQQAVRHAHAHWDIQQTLVQPLENAYREVFFKESAPGAGVEPTTF